MIRSLVCLTALSLTAQGPPPPRPVPHSLPAPTGQPSSNPLKEVVRVDLTAEEAGTPEALTASLYAFLTFAAPQWEKSGFFERSTAVSVQKQDGIAQVWTPYEIRLAADGPVLYTGVNALQCAWDGKRWWITHLEFQSAPVPALTAEAKK